MKPFNLEAAKEGKKVVTRDGSSVKITSFEGSHRQPISATIYHTSPVAICDVAYPASGSFFESGSEHHLDLFMADDEPKQEVCDLQKWCKEILPIVQAAANGEDIEHLDDDYWCAKDALCFNFDTKYRIKPKVKMVNGFEVPLHETVEPYHAQEYFTPSLAASNMWTSKRWGGYKTDKNLLDRGMVYLDKESAVKCAKAMLGINPEGDE